MIRSEYHAGEAAYENISHMISLPQKTAEPQPPVINKPTGAETLPDEDDTIWPEVDFAVLREINPDMITKNPMQLKAFIKNKAAEKHISAQLVMQNYMLERLLERISLCGMPKGVFLRLGDIDWQENRKGLL